MFLLFAAATAFADSATWNLSPTSGDWGTATNWTPENVPNGPNDTATLGVSNITDLDSGNNDTFDTEVNRFLFEVGASAFTIRVENFGSFHVSLTISGVGITNNSGTTQNFVVDQTDDRSSIQFLNSATAGDLTVFTNNYNAATDFFDTSSAGNATLIAYDGLILFAGDSTGNTARVEVFTVFSGSNGYLDISAHNAPGVTVGSIEGDGLVLLGANKLTVGGNNLSTTFSGVIQDGGSLTKIGTGRLILTNANTYAGGTEVEGGALIVDNRTGSGTGSGALQIHAGTLGGRGTIAGAVTLGTGGGAGAVLAPGKSALKPRTLSIQGAITFNSDATCKIRLNGIHAIADKVVANGVTIDSGALFSFSPRTSGSLSIGAVFTVIDNTAATPITGPFSNLADGEVITANGTNFQGSYEGGDGNDLTLTVVP